MPLAAGLGQTSTVVIVGAGHAGGSAAAQLRQQGWQGRIVMIGEEAELPYQRPPLSKEWLSGETTLEKLFLRKGAFYEKGHIEVRLTETVASIDRQEKVVTTGQGHRQRYDHLVLATGARPRELPHAPQSAQGVFYLRNLRHARALTEAFKTARRIALVGGGYIGLEVAASARKLGIEVTLLEVEPRLLGRVASPELADFFAAKHIEAGTTFLFGVQLIELQRHDGKIVAARLSNGQSIPCDAILIGIGAAADDGLAKEAELLCDGGIVVDADARTSDEAIFAAGDCTRRPLASYAGLHRIESVPNALEQARQAAAAICGRPRPAPEVPWFWSNQYDLKLQIAGLSLDATKRIARTLPLGGFAVYHLSEANCLRAVEAVNCPEEFATARQLIAAGATINIRALEQGGMSLKDAAHAI